MQAQFLSHGKFTQTSIYSNEHALYFFYILYSKKMSVRNNAKVAYRLCDNKLKYTFLLFFQPCTFKKNILVIIHTFTL